MKWSNFYLNLPIKMRKYLKKKIGELSDFVYDSYSGDSSLFISPSTKIEISFSVESSGLLLAIWFPDAEDPTYTEHQIFIKNPYSKLIAQ